MQGMAEHPRCAARLRSGERCRSVVVADSEFCAHHRLTAELDGPVPRELRPRPPRQSSPLVRLREQRSSVKARPPAGNGSRNGKVEPSQVRPRAGARSPGRAAGAATAERPPTLRGCPGGDLRQFAATFCLDDLAAVHRRGGEALLRERVAELSAGERAVLRAVRSTPPEPPREPRIALTNR
jgi:hypothetical protein